MITSIKLYDAQKLTYVDLDDLSLPLQKFSWEYPIVGDTLGRPFSAGRHDTRKTVNFMTLDAEGEILGSSTSDYWSKRKGLCNVALPRAAQTVYRHSYIEITLDDSTTYHADLQLASFSIPLAATGAPTVSPFMLSWEVNVGYWLNSMGAAAYL